MLVALPRRRYRILNLHHSAALQLPAGDNFCIFYKFCATEWKKCVTENSHCWITSCKKQRNMESTPVIYNRLFSGKYLAYVCVSSPFMQVPFIYVCTDKLVFLFLDNSESNKKIYIWNFIWLQVFLSLLRASDFTQACTSSCSDSCMRLKHYKCSKSGIKALAIEMLSDWCIKD